jgi:hydrogenase nickel incorporation protein HypA/HybF
VHELAITESIVAAVVERMPDTPVRRVRLEIGRLSGVVPDAVRFCFDLVAAGTTLDGAVLEIDEPGGRVACRRCGVEFETDEVLALCPCGSADVELLRGRELRIREVEVAA